MLLDNSSGLPRKLDCSNFSDNLNDTECWDLGNDSSSSYGNVFLYSGLMLAASAKHALSF